MSILETCVAVAQNPALFNVYSTAANMMPEHAPELMHTDAAVSGFLTAVSKVLAALSWLDNTDNLSTGSILQLSQLAAALPEMNDCSDVEVAVKLIDMRGQLEQCCHFLKFLGSDNAVCLVPVAQIADELQDTIALQEQATGQQLASVLSRCQGLFESADHMAFVKHFAMQDSALYNAYLQQRWQLETDRLMQLQGMPKLTYLFTLLQCWHCQHMSVYINAHIQLCHQVQSCLTVASWPVCLHFKCSSLSCCVHA